ncbi:MAG: hypothetical protein V3S26_03770 [Acidimicrobiia bacterium]
MSSTGLQTSLDLLELGTELFAQRYRREHAEASEEEIAAAVADWLKDRSQAPHGDAVGRRQSWPKTS